MAKNTTLSEQFQNLIEKSSETEVKSIPLTHIYMSEHFLRYVQQALQ